MKLFFHDDVLYGALEFDIPLSVKSMKKTSFFMLGKAAKRIPMSAKRSSNRLNYVQSSMFDRSKHKNRVFEFDYQLMNTFKFVR